MTLLMVFTLRNNSTLKAAAIGACMVAAEAIRNEPDITPNSINRVIWANRQPEVNAEQMMPVLAMNSTVQSKWEARMQQEEATRYDDGDIQFIVNSNIDRFATG